MGKEYITLEDLLFQIIKSEEYFGILCRKYHFPNEFYEIMEDDLTESNWLNISIYQTLSEDFIREYQDKVYWPGICYHQTLSEDFIREFQDKVHWRGISAYQGLSEDFIREFQGKVCWASISQCQELSIEFRQEFVGRLEDDNKIIFI